MGTDERGYQTAYLGAGADVPGFFLRPSGKAGISYGKCPANGVSRL